MTMIAAADVLHITTSHVDVYKSIWSVGIDLGQAHDPTAFCAVERLTHIGIGGNVDGMKMMPGHVAQPRAELSGPQKMPDQLRIRALQRLPIGTDYTAQCAMLAGLLANPLLHDAQVFVDATGVGKPISDLLKRNGIKHKPVWITSGNEDASHGNGWSIPKMHLISRLQAALHSKELKIAKALPDAAAFTRELQEFRVTWTEAGNMKFGARQGAHDDLVLAAALAVYGVTALRHTAVVTPLRM